jgi:hypothetical protein
VLGTGTALAPLIVALLSGGGRWWLLPVAVGVASVALALLELIQTLSIPAEDEPQPAPFPAAGLLALDRLRPPYGICETLFGNGRNGVPAPAALPLATANLALAVFLGGHDHRSPAGQRGLHQSPR